MDLKNQWKEFWIELRLLSWEVFKNICERIDNWNHEHSDYWFDDYICTPIIGDIIFWIWQHTNYAFCLWFNDTFYPDNEEEI